MRTHSSITHAIMQPRDSQLGRVAGGIAIMVLMAGGAGTAEAAISSHVSGGHADSRKPAVSLHPSKGLELHGPSHIIGMPWMY